MSDSKHDADVAAAASNWPLLHAIRLTAASPLSEPRERNSAIHGDGALARRSVLFAHAHRHALRTSVPALHSAAQRRFAPASATAACSGSNGGMERQEKSASEPDPHAAIDAPPTHHTSDNLTALFARLRAGGSKA